ncbi:hypothetical protein SNE40_018578 [Patella caerulea]|uniref:5'-nucleotidase domain-containing protein 1 n=1 Tax=Patella caerulea TaxID=87958 RepID=A0AAN8J574_PATCE
MDKQEQTARTDSYFCLKDYDAYGFDLDHTLAKYKLVNVFNLSYDSISNYLVNEHGYDARIQHDLHKYKDFIAKGLVLDIERGNILKLGAQGEILMAKHGTKPISSDKLIDIYGGDLMFEHSKTILKTVKNSSKDYRFFENYFDIPGLVAMARIVDILDEKGGSDSKKHSYLETWSDIMKALMNCYTYEAFRMDTGGFFPGIKKNPENYVEKCSDDVKTWLKELKGNNKSVFLVTSSYIDFASLLLETIIGKDWKSYFDISVFRARKPAFFTDGHPFLRIDDNNIEKEPVQDLKKDGLYSQGNHKELETFIANITNKKHPKVVYFGDNICADCFPSKNYADWATVLLLEEMDAEGYLCSDGTVPGHENDGEPSKKRSKFEHSSLVTPEEIEYLLTEEWGPFLYHDVKDEKSINNGSRIMNTFWGSVIAKYSCITVPSLEYIAGVPLSHKFQKFTTEEGNTKGFHPGIPSSLLP